MNINIEMINWPAVGLCFVIGQVYLTLWFTLVFGEQWAKAYGHSKSKAEHTKEVPAYTYAIGAVCTFFLVLGLAILQISLEINSIVRAIQFAAFISTFIVLATALPGYSFLKRWRAFTLAAGSQVSLIFILSIVLALWK